MFHWFRPFVLAVLIGTIALGSLGCSRLPASECDRLAVTVEKGYVRVLQFQGRDAASVERLASDLKVVAWELRAVKLTDPSLERWRDRFVALYRNLANAYWEISRSLGLAAGAESTRSGLQQVERARSRLERVGRHATDTARDTDRLAARLNRYCNAD
jgi:hypothetical protein